MTWWWPRLRGEDCKDARRGEISGQEKEIAWSEEDEGALWHLGKASMKRVADPCSTCL